MIVHSCITSKGSEEWVMTHLNSGGGVVEGGIVENGVREGVVEEGGGEG